MKDREKKTVGDVLDEAKGKIREQLTDTANLGKRLGGLSKGKVDEVGKKIEGSKEDAKVLAKESGESIITLLSFMLVL